MISCSFSLGVALYETSLGFVIALLSSGDGAKSSAVAGGMILEVAIAAILGDGLRRLHLGGLLGKEARETYCGKQHNNNKSYLYPPTGFVNSHNPFHDGCDII